MEKKGLKALLLVGGFGTRLRPLTLSKAKPLVEFINKPIICHQIEALKSVGVTEIVLAINYQPERMYDFIKEAEAKYEVKITCSKENEPLGTAGPIGLAKSILQDSEGEEIFVFNSDITCRFPLREMLEFHRKHGHEGTIAVTKVKEPSRYGVILSNENNKIIDFIEKPKDFIGDNINAGLYIFNKKFLNRVEPKPISIEREVFPQMAKDGELYVFQLEGFWADIGQPKDYLIGTNLYLNDPNIKEKLATGSNIQGNVVIVSVFILILRMNQLDCLRTA
jgi:mannose-1-phosphate guanylyltransferase